MSALPADGLASDILAAFLSGQPEAIDKILDEHVDDGRGDCRTCNNESSGRHLEHPCTLRLAAERARIYRVQQS